MHANLTGQLWGMPFNIIGDMSDPPFWNSAILAAALSAILVTIANLWLDHRRNRKVINQRRQQTYSMLKGRNAVVADFYESYATSFIKFHIQRAIRHRTGVPAPDPLYYNDNERQMKRVDEYSTYVDEEYGKLVEIISFIPLIFSNKSKLIDDVEMMNQKFIDDEVKNILKKYRPKIIEERINQLDPPIKIPQGVIPSLHILDPSQTQQQIDMENALMADIEKEIKAKIKTNIQDPVDALLASMIKDITCGEVNAKSWRSRIQNI